MENSNMINEWYTKYGKKLEEMKNGNSELMKR